MNGKTFDLIVCGAGAAGMMAAITAAERGLSVLLLEKNDRPCRKVYITGKGRCNITNHCTWQECVQNIPTGGKFLCSALQAFPPAEVMAFFEGLGCPVKTERGSRVFPCSDKSADVIDALRDRSRALNIRLRQATVTEVLTENGAAAGVRTREGSFCAPAVLLALGGASYPRTGSTGDGYAIAEKLGHTVVPPVGSLVPLESDSPLCAGAAGLSLRNISLTMKNSKGKTVFTDFGEAELTDFGLTGPTVLSASVHMGRDAGFTVYLDLKPALSPEALDARILRDLQKYQNCPMETALTELLPRALIRPLLAQIGIDPALPANSLKKQLRQALLQNLKALPIPIRGKRPIDEAIVTSGGISTREVDPRTMESRRIPGLYFAGELLDADGYTGGFNLQIAWATGRAAAAAVCDRKERN